jgi:hypothetical protein
VFGIAGLAGVLDDRFRLAMRGRRTALPRHQTLSTTLDWSYQLLPETERRVLRRLAVFAGFFTITEATGVLVDGSDADILESIANLAAKSLLVVNLETPCPLTVCSKRRAPTHCKSWKRAASVWHTRVGMRDNALPRWRRPTLRGKPRLRRPGLQDIAIWSTTCAPHWT